MATLDQIIKDSLPSPCLLHGIPCIYDSTWYHRNLPRPVAVPFIVWLHTLGSCKTLCAIPQRNQITTTRLRWQRTNHSPWLLWLELWIMPWLCMIRIWLHVYSWFRPPPWKNWAKGCCPPNPVPWKPWKLYVAPPWPAMGSLGSSPAS